MRLEQALGSWSSSGGEGAGDLLLQVEQELQTKVIKEAQNPREEGLRGALAF